MVLSSRREAITEDTPLVELVIHVQRRDYAREASFEELYRRHSPNTRSLITRLIQNRNKQDTEDLLQSTFVAVWNKLPEKKPDVPFIPWLHRIAANQAFDYLRSKKRVDPILLSLDEMEAEEGQSPLPLASKEIGPEEKACLKEAVETILSELDEKTRFCLLAHVHGGLSQQEIADILDTDQRRVSERICRARKRLRQLHPDILTDIQTTRKGGLF